MSHEFSTVMFSAVKRALAELGWLEAVRTESSAGTRAVLDAPEQAKFHPGTALDEVVEVTARLHGLEGAERLLRDVTSSSMVGVVAPLARVYLALKGDSPAVLLAQFGSLLRVAARGLEVTWVAESEHGGVLSLRYPKRCSLAIGYGWRGTMLHLLTFCEATGTVEVLDFGEGGHAVRLRVTWQ